MAKNNDTVPTIDNAPVVDTQNTPVPAPASKKVEVDADVLKGILDRLKEVESKTSEFEQTASQDQIRKIESLRAQGKLIKAVKVRRFEGKLVVGWRTTEDKVWFADGKLNEIQMRDIFFEDGSKVNTSEVQFSRGCTYESYEVLKEAQTATGAIEYTLLLPDGKQMVILHTYVN